MGVKISNFLIRWEYIITEERKYGSIYDKKNHKISIYLFIFLLFQYLYSKAFAVTSCTRDVSHSAIVTPLFIKISTLLWVIHPDWTIINHSKNKWEYEMLCLRTHLGKLWLCNIMYEIEVPFWVCSWNFHEKCSYWLEVYILTTQK